MKKQYDELKLKELVESGSSIKKAAEQLQIPKTSALYICRRLGIKSQYQKFHRSNFFNEDFFEVIDTEEKAYWLGYLFADGSITTQNGRHRINLSIKESDFNHLKKYQKALNSNLEPGIKKIKLKQENYPYLIKDFYLTYRMILTSTKMYNDLLDKGITERKSLTLKPPLNVPEILIRHFIRGYFDGDGSVFIAKRDKKIVFSILGTYEFLDFIRKKTNLEVNILLKKKDAKIYRLTSGTVKHKVFQFYLYIYQNATVFLERKKEKFDLFFEGLK